MFSLIAVLPAVPIVKLCKLLTRSLIGGRIVLGTLRIHQCILTGSVLAILRLFFDFRHTPIEPMDKPSCWPHITHMIASAVPIPHSSFIPCARQPLLVLEVIKPHHHALGKEFQNGAVTIYISQTNGLQLLSNIQINNTC